MDGNEIRQILQNYQTPLYCFDIDELQRRVQYLRDSLPEKVKLAYAAKANTFIVKEIEPMIDYYEICSPGEFEVCLDLDVDLSKVVLSGVYKAEEDIQTYLERKIQIGKYTVESLAQLELLDRLSKKYKQSMNVILRLTSVNQFGMDTDTIIGIVRNQNHYSYLNIVGIQYFSGTQKHSIKVLQKELNRMVKLIRRLKRDYGFEAQSLEYGPGLPVDYFTSDFDEKSYLEQFKSLLESIDLNVEIVLEMGRTIAASCGSYITTVVDNKTNKGVRFAIVDGGIHQITYYGQNMGMRTPPFSLCQDHPIKSEEAEWNICGALCSVNDILIKGLPIADLRIGDAFVFENAGAYCPTEGISLFLTRNLPDIILKKGNHFQSVRFNIKTSKINGPYYE